MELSRLEQALKNCWDERTSSDSTNWSPDNPALGQCAVTALVVQDYLGGEIVWAILTLPDKRRASHYFNKIDGKEIDLTKEQIPEGTIVPKGKPKTDKCPTRDYILSFPITLKQRYELLRQRVQEYINTQL